MRIAIAQLADGDSLDQVFVLVSKQLGQTNTNKLFIKAECGERQRADSLPGVECDARDV